MHPIRAIQAFFLVLFGKPLPSEWLGMAAPTEPEAGQAIASSSVSEQPESKKEEVADLGALRVLSLLQNDGRLLDFLFEDIETFSNDEVGAAAREVHRGCRQTLETHLDLGAVREEEEESKITIAEKCDPGTVRITGNVPAAPPYSGTLRHRGWKATAVRLPRIPPGDAAMVLAPAELEME